ncbi:ATP-binding response regulator [Stenotrophomonas mori]|nr:ATP-binding protein [Stenotrophomonas mori]
MSTPEGGALDSLPLYQEVFEAVGTGFCVIEVLFEQACAVDFIHWKVNAAFERITGLSGVVGRRATEVLPGLDDYWFRVFGRVVNEGVPAQFERYLPQLGRWYSVEAVRLGPAPERRVAVLFFDISLRKQVETDLAESEARFSALADGLPMPVWVLDDLGRVRFVNSAFGSFFGLGAEQPFGPRWWVSLLHPADLKVFEYALDEALKNESELHVNARLRRHDGQWRWLEMNAVPRFAADGRFVGLAGNSPDVTERREIDMGREELLEAERAARNAAEATTRMKDEFLATLSHELRTPLTTILGWSELLLQRMEAEHPMRRGVEVIASSAMAQKRLISDMLDLSSMLLGKVQLEAEVVDLAEQVHEAVRLQELVAQEKSQALRVAVPSSPCLVLGDATRLQQVLWNLLSNAIKFTPAHGEVDVLLWRDRAHYVVDVRDNGDGIAPEFLAHLFSRFSQADSTTTRRHGGLGLGLAIVQQLAELHGGSVTAESPGAGHGATFRMRLPAYRAQSADNPRRAVRRPTPGIQVVAAQSLAGLRILAVEDQPEVLAYLRRVLEEQGARVVAAVSAAEALEQLDLRGAEGFDVLVSDIGMPGMDGYGLVRTLRETLGVSAGELPAVAVTALARDDDRRRAIAAGFQNHVTKPYSVAQLVGAIRQACMAG